MGLDECGCTIEGVGYCGEYAKLDGKYVALTLPEGHTHGKMPFCGKSGLRATIAGELRGEELVAKSFALTTE